MLTGLALNFVSFRTTVLTNLGMSPYLLYLNLSPEEQKIMHYSQHKICRGCTRVY